MEPQALDRLTAGDIERAAQDFKLLVDDFLGPLARVVGEPEFAERVLAIRDRANDRLYELRVEDFDRSDTTRHFAATPEQLGAVQVALGHDDEDPGGCWPFLYEPLCIERGNERLLTDEEEARMLGVVQQLEPYREPYRNGENR